MVLFKNLGVIFVCKYSRFRVKYETSVFSYAYLYNISPSHDIYIRHSSKYLIFDERVLICIQFSWNTDFWLLSSMWSCTLFMYQLSNWGHVIDGRSFRYLCHSLQTIWAILVLISDSSSNTAPTKILSQKYNAVKFYQ